MSDANIRVSLPTILEAQMTKPFLILAALLAAFQISGCAVAVGAGGAIIVDDALEQENGGDGLF